MSGRFQPIPKTILKNQWVLLFLVLAFAAAAIWQTGLFTKRQQLEQIRKTGESRTTLYTNSLKGTLEKYRHIPYLLSRDTRIHSLLKDHLPPIKVNPHLEDFGIKTDALIFVTDSQGNTVASSNWRSNKSLVGKNFSFRPYFQEALQGKSGGYYAVGLQTRKPGFFISYPVFETGRLLGVVVIKVDLEKLQKMWQESGETIVVSDAHGVLFLSSRPEWKYTSLRPLPERTVELLRTVQYLQQPLTALEVRRQTTDQGNILILDDSTFLEQSSQLTEYGWRIHYLTNLDPVSKSARQAMAIATVICIAMLLGLLYLRERRQKIISRREAREAKAIKQLNQLLKLEIEQHQETERTLRHTQKELVQAGKLAALGHMSAAISHELNQPVTAIRTFVASCKIFLEREQSEKVVENLDFIGQLTERMATITGQLKTFARKSKGRRESVDLGRVINRVLTFTQLQFSDSQIILNTDLPADGEVIIEGDSLQLEQVLNNLIRNGLDAMKERRDKKFRIELKSAAGYAILSFHDSGPGISEEAQELLFDPFYTTKDIGEGLGLGLSISYGIVHEMNGTIQAGNHPEGGAVFTLRLPLAETSQHESRDRL